MMQNPPDNEIVSYDILQLCFKILTTVFNNKKFFFEAYGNTPNSHIFLLQSILKGSVERMYYCHHLHFVHPTISE